MPYDKIDPYVLIPHAVPTSSVSSRKQNLDITSEDFEATFRAENIYFTKAVHIIAKAINQLRMFYRIITHDPTALDRLYAYVLYMVDHNYLVNSNEPKAVPSYCKFKFDQPTTARSTITVCSRGGGFYLTSKC